MLRNPICSGSLAFLIALSVGCNDDGLPSRAAVTGQVMYRQKPLPDASVTFNPVNGSRSATGITDANGRFTLGTYSIDDGAVIGRHKVAVVAHGPPRALRPGETGTGLPGETMPGDPVIPSKYFSADTSGLTHEVAKGSNTVNLELKD